MALKYLRLFALITSFLLVLLISSVYFMDPLCQHRCSEIQPERKTQNVYYQGAQIAKIHPENKILLLGSSRGQTTSPIWLLEQYEAPSLNLSLGGADLLLKLALLKISQESGQDIKRIIWLADYFELIPENTDSKVFQTPALRAYLPPETRPSGLNFQLKKLQSLIDHKSLEALFSGQKKSLIGPLGAGEDIDFTACTSDHYAGLTKPHRLPKEVELLYENYRSSIFRFPQAENYWQYWERELALLSQRGIQVDIVIAPYHPEFMRRLKQEQPQVWSWHLNWIERIESLQLPGISVKNYFSGIPGDDSSERFWNDGVHFSCKAAVRMLAQ